MRSDRLRTPTQFSVRHSQRRQDEQFLFRVAGLAIKTLRFKQRAHDCRVFRQFALRPRPRAQALDAQRCIVPALCAVDCVLCDLERDASAADGSKLTGKL